MTTVLIPGSFDPLHNGHVDIVDQAVELFGSVVFAVLHNPAKPSGLFTVDERVALASASLSDRGESDRGDVRVAAFGGLVVDAAREAGVDFIVKGVRTAADFDVEQQMAHMNHSVAGVRTVLVPCRPGLGFVSSRYVREIAQHGGEVAHLVPSPVAAALADRFAQHNE